MLGCANLLPILLTQIPFLNLNLESKNLFMHLLHRCMNSRQSSSVLPRPEPCLYPPTKPMYPLRFLIIHFPTPLKEENLLLKQQLSKSMTSLISNGKVAWKKKLEPYYKVGFTLFRFFRWVWHQLTRETLFLLYGQRTTIITKFIRR